MREVFGASVLFLSFGVLRQSQNSRMASYYCWFSWSRHMVVLEAQNGRSSRFLSLLQRRMFSNILLHLPKFGLFIYAVYTYRAWDVPRIDAETSFLIWTLPTEQSCEKIFIFTVRHMRNLKHGACPGSLLHKPGSLVPRFLFAVIVLVVDTKFRG